MQLTSAARPVKVSTLMPQRIAFTGPSDRHISLGTPDLDALEAHPGKHPRDQRLAVAKSVPAATPDRPDDGYRADNPYPPGRMPDYPTAAEDAAYRAGLADGYDDGASDAAASPDERLREADRAVILEWAKFTRDESAGYWGRREEDVYQRLLAAADREAPDEETKR